MVPILGKLNLSEKIRRKRDMKKRLLSILLALSLALALLPGTALALSMKDDDDVAYPVTGGNIYFDKATGRVTGCDQTVTAADIPSEIEGVAVTAIEVWAFDHCRDLTSVTIPDSVTDLRHCAFYGCSGLTSLELPDSVTYLGMCVFCDCTALTGIVIPDGVTLLAEYLFENCTSLTSVTIPDSVTYIGYHTFSNCSSLTAVEIPGSVTLIDEEAFIGCTSLTSVTMPDSVTSIGSGAFNGCDSLERVYYSGTKAQWNAMEIGDDNDPLLNAEIVCNSTGPSEPTGSAFSFDFAFGGLDPQTGDLKMSIVVYMNGIELLTIPLTLHLG